MQVERTLTAASIQQELATREMNTQQGTSKPMHIYPTDASVPNHVHFLSRDSTLNIEKVNLSGPSTSQAYQSVVPDHSLPANPPSDIDHAYQSILTNHSLPDLSPFSSTGQAYQNVGTNHSFTCPIQPLPEVPPLTNGVSSPAQLPTSPDGLIGVLPNGVHVSRVPYSPAVKSALKKALPTHGDVIKAANLTAQLTLQCMVRINATKSRNMADKFNSPPPLLLSRSSQLVDESYLRAIAESVPELTNMQAEDSNTTQIDSKMEKLSTKTRKRKRNHTLLEDHGQNVEESFSESSMMEKKSKKRRRRKRTEVKGDQIDQKGSSEVVLDLTLNDETPLPQESQKPEKQSKKANRKRVHSMMKGATRIIQESIPEATPLKEKLDKIKKTIPPVVKCDTHVSEEDVSMETAKPVLLLSQPNVSSPLDDSQLAFMHGQSRKRKHVHSKLKDDTSPPASSSDMSARRLASLNASARVSALMKPEPKKAKSILKVNPSAMISTTGCMKRMASLNARACVAAMMESEKTYSKSKKNRLCSRKSSSRSNIKKSPSPSVRGSPSRYSGPSSIAEFPIVPATVDQLTKSGPFVYVNLGPKATEEVIDPPSYNTSGLLYNGDTIHPTKCRIFYTNLGRELSLPRFVFPTLVPSRVDYIGAMVEKAIENRRQRKGAKIIKVRISLEIMKRHLRLDEVFSPQTPA